MTDKEYVRRYMDTAERVQRENLPSIKPGNPTAQRHREEFIQRFKHRAKGIAERNVWNMPVGPDKSRAMRRSIRKTRDGHGVLHVQPESSSPYRPSNDTGFLCGGADVHTCICRSVPSLPRTPDTWRTPAGA